MGVLSPSWPPELDERLHWSRRLKWEPERTHGVLTSLLPALSGLRRVPWSPHNVLRTTSLEVELGAVLFVRILVAT